MILVDTNVLLRMAQPSHTMQCASGFRGFVAEDAERGSVRRATDLV